MKEKKIRTFIAIKIVPNELLLSQWQKLRKGLENELIRWVREENLHLTLRFIGETSFKEAEQLIALLKEELKNSSVFSFSLKEFQHFQHRHRPKVVFVNAENSAELENLAETVYHQVEKVGFGKEKRNFNAHVTLGRIKYLNDKNSFLKVMESIGKKDVKCTVNVTEVILYQSILKPEGPVYRPVETFKLKRI